MIRGFTVNDGSVLCGLLAESEDDIVIKTDDDGFLVYVSPAIERLGMRPAEMLFLPHVADLAHREYQHAIRASVSEAMRQCCPLDRMEFPAATRPNSGGPAPWYALSLRPTPEDAGMAAGGLGILRAIARPRADGGAQGGATRIDPLTGLANRAAFMERLAEVSQSRTGGALALFAIDRFRAIRLSHGQSRADEVLWAFAQFLRKMFGDDHGLARLEGERFVALVPEQEPAQALALARETIRVFAELSRSEERGSAGLTASGGVAGLSGGAEGVLAQAELALTVARGAGGQRVELADILPGCLRRRA